MTSPERNSASAGFTLIEVLATLSVITVCLTSIGSLVAANSRSVRGLDEHLALASVVRTVESMIPDRWQGASGALSGAIDRYDWEIEFRPFASLDASSASSLWIPERVTITVSDPSGGRLEVDTIKLRRKETQ
jgi:prepilin-type N-terminal cleavage/methylation domain-containing protein